MSNTFDYGWIADVANEVGIEDTDFTTLSTLGFLGRTMVGALDRTNAIAIQAKENQFVSTCNSLIKMYQHAVDNSIEPDKAKSSTLPVKLYVYIDDILNADIIDVNTDKRLLKLGSELVFSVGDYKFYLDYPINVYTYKVNGIRKYYAQYDMTEKNPVSSLKNAVIPLRKFYFNSRYCVSLSVSLRDTIKYVSEVGYTDASSGSMFTLPYSNYIEHIDVKYRDTNTDAYRTLNTAMFFDRSISGETLFYLIRKSTVVFMNKYKGGDFIPVSGGRFRFTVYATPLVSFSSYAGDNLSVRMGDDDTFDIDFSVVGGTLDGKKPPTLEELRTLVKTEKKTLNALISATDVDTYLASNGNTDTMYNTYKYVDNFYDRIYNVILRLGSLSKIVPTNSVDVLIDDGYCKSYGGGRFLVPSIDQKFIAVKDQIDPSLVRAIPYEKFIAEKDTTYKGFNDDISYAIPFQLCYDRKYNFVSIFSKLMNETRETIFSYLDTSAEVFVCESMTYEYDLDAKNDAEYYNFNFKIQTDDESLIENIKDDPEYVSVYLSLINASGKELCYIKADIKSYDASTQQYNVNAGLKMLSPVYSKYLDVRTFDTILMDDTTTVDTTVDINDAYPRISVYVKDSSPSIVTPSKFVSRNGKRLVNVFDIYRDVKDPDDGTLFNELSSYMPTQVSKRYTRSKTTNAYDAVAGVLLDKIPVVKYVYYYSEQNDIQSLIHSEMEILDSISGKVDGMFKVRMNFVNSYGYSKLVQIGLDGRDIGTTHLIPKIKVGLSEDSTLTKESLGLFINSYLSSINFKDGDVFYFTNLVTSIKAEYADVKFVELISMNGISSDNQKIYMKTATNAKFISEVINISRDDSDTLNIDIEFVYE